MAEVDSTVVLHSSSNGQQPSDVPERTADDHVSSSQAAEDDITCGKGGADASELPEGDAALRKEGGEWMESEVERSADTNDDTHIDNAEGAAQGESGVYTINTNQNNENGVEKDGEVDLVIEQNASTREDVMNEGVESQDDSLCQNTCEGQEEVEEGSPSNNICGSVESDSGENKTETNLSYDDLPEEDRTEHFESNQTLNNNVSCSEEAKGCVDESSVYMTSPQPESSMHDSAPNARSKSKGLHTEVFNEKISSDGGSVEIAEEAEEECECSDQRNSNQGVLGTESQHSKDAPLSLVTALTNNNLESQKSDFNHVQTHKSQVQKHPSVQQSGLAPEQDMRVDDSKMSNGDVSEAVEDIEDDLLSELAAELDQAAPRSTLSVVPESQELPNDTGKEREDSEEDDQEEMEKDKMVDQRRIEQEWKQKYCHAEAELQSLQVAVQAKSHQQIDVQKERRKIENEVKRETEAVRKVHLLRIKELEKEVEQKKKENAVARERQVAHDIAAKKAISQLQQEMVHRVDQVKKMYADAVKERENMVIRYAKSEKENLDLKKAKEELERRRKDAGQGLEVIATHNRQLKTERAKLTSDLDAKDVEITGLQKEIEQMKDDVSSVDIKVKWAQNKLRTELESHKETKVKLAKTEQRLQEAKEETEQIRKNCQEMICTYQESEEIRSNSLDIQLKEKEEELKQHFQEKEDHMELHHIRLQELEALKKAHHDTLSELDALKVKSKCLEDERLHTEGLLTQFKGLLNSQKEENRKLTRQMDDLKSLKRQLDESKESVQMLQKNIASQKMDEKDLETELETSRDKESELLQFTERMTAKNAELNTENITLSSKVDKLTHECRNLTAELEEARTEVAQLTADLNQERQYREREVALLSARLGEKSKVLDQVKVQLDDAKDETKTLKRKNAANLKDLTRQLQIAKKKIESLESDGTSPANNKDNFSSESRTSSTGSLDTLGNTALNGGTIHMSSGGSNGGGSVGRQDDSPQASQGHTVAIAGGNDFPGIDKGMLVDRIVRLQKQLQRKGDKIEFLQEHVSQLVEEVQKKSKIIQQYIMREEAGALTPAASDVNKQKLVRKTMAQMSKQSGIMASLYRSHSPDPNMTLDLSLEINCKLQSVLEDTLLKNITLKENIDTLGQEIARLSEEAQFRSSPRTKPVRKK